MIKYMIILSFLHEKLKENMEIKVIELTVIKSATSGTFKCVTNHMESE